MNRSPTFQFMISIEGLRDALYQAIIRKNKAVQLYNYAIAQSPNEFILSLLSIAESIELSMKNRLEDFYITNFGPIPDYILMPKDVSFPSFQSGIEMSIRDNAHAVLFERQLLDQLEDLGFDLVRYILQSDIAQQTLLNAVYSNYLHFFVPVTFT